MEHLLGFLSPGEVEVELCHLSERDGVLWNSMIGFFFSKVKFDECIFFD